MTYAFSQLCQRVEHIEDIDNDRSRRDDKSSMVNPQWMGVSQENGESPRSHAEIETIIKDLQEQLNAHENRLTGKGVITGEFSYTSFGDLKDDVLKEIPRGSFGIFVDAWSICAFSNMDYTPESSFL